MGFGKSILGMLSGKARKSRKAQRAAVERIMQSHMAKVAARQAMWADEEDRFREMVAAIAGAGQWSKFEPLMGRRIALSDMSISAGYDAAQTTDDNRMHWAMADALSADASNSPAVRTILRNRSRYEVANNCYASGVGLTIANDCIGTGPHLNIDADESGSISDADADVVEALFNEWCRAVNLPELLRTMRHARRQDGEAFALLVSNPGVAHDVKLGLRLIEADMIGAFGAIHASGSIDDGLRFDQYGNVISYDILRRHPGDTSYGANMVYDVWPASLVLHWFRPRRPGQHRGLVEIIAALPLYATLRRYTQATLDAAETAADLAILLQTQAGAEFDSEPTEALPFSTVPFARRMIMAMPQGYEAKPFQASQPTQMYSNFKREVAGEIGRCENVSRNVVLLDSSESNFASGQLDHRTTYRQHDIDRENIGNVLLDRIFGAWLAEARLINGYLPASMRGGRRLPPHSWHWDSNELGDPLKLAKAKAENLRCGLTSLPELYAQRGLDWNKALRLTARGYGISETELLAMIVKSIFSSGVESVESQDQEEPPQPPASQADRVKQGEAA
jgi:capsid protein